MATYIRRSPDIQGLHLGTKEVKIVQFADDSTCLLRSFASLSPLLSFLGEFASWSGLTINKDKSMILLPNEDLSGIRSLHGIPVVKQVKILGIWFTRLCSPDEHYQLNFKPQLTKIRGICESWNARSLSIKGKVTLVNSLLISLLQYQSASIFTPPQVFKDYRKLVAEFIWNGRKAKVAYATLILPVAQGGLNVMDLDTRVQVSTLQWVRRLIKRPNSNTAWSLKHLLQETIWYNKFVTSDGRVLANKRWENSGIRRINDICQLGEGRLCSHLEIAARYNVRCSFLDALKLRLSVPMAWRQALTPDWREPPLLPSLSGIVLLLPGEEPLDTLAVSPKKMYRSFILQSNTQSTAFKRWSEPTSQPLQIQNSDEWNEANLSVYRAVRETKLQSLHFKIMNRVIPCNKFLKQIRIKSTDSCELCGLEDSLLHFFFECTTVKGFWASLCAWFDRVENLALANLSPRHFMFGVPRSHYKEKMVNFILMNTKFFIFRQRLFHGGKLEILQWLREFKVKLLMERHINLSEGRPRLFGKWAAILEAIG